MGFHYTIDTKAQPKLCKILEDVLERKWLLQSIVEHAAWNVCRKEGIYGELPNLRTCEIVQSALIFHIQARGLLLMPKTCFRWIIFLDIFLAYSWWRSQVCHFGDTNLSQQDPSSRGTKGRCLYSPCTKDSVGASCC